MISYFPSIYPDELLYSQLARYYAKSGYLAYTFAAEDLFQSKTVRPDIEFLNAYTPEAVQMITRTMPMTDIVMYHTMFPYYGRFIPPERRRQAFDSLVNMGTEYHNLLSIPKRKDRISRHLRYCPECVKEDRQKYGETYWHRVQQMVGVNICPVHHCCLIGSDIVTSSNVSPSLVTAEEVVEIPEEIIFSVNDLECHLAEYVAEVFQSDIDLQSNVTTGRVLHSRMEGTKYLSKRGEQRNMSLLHADFMEFYKAFPNNEFNQQWQLGKLFSNDRHNTLEICMLAMFLGIPTDDLVHMTLPENTQSQLFDKKVMELHEYGLNYRRISTELNAAYDTVKAIGEGLYGKYHYYSDTPQKGGAKKKDWSSIDTHRLPYVKKAISELWGSETARPNRITVGLIERYLGLPKKGLKHCPMCLAEIRKYQETQEEFWARLVIWAANIIITNGQPLHMTAIMRQTNMRKAKILECVPYLDKYADTDIINILRNLLFYPSIL